MFKKIMRSFLAALSMVIIYLLMFIAYVWVTVKCVATGRTFQLDITYKTLAEVLEAVELDLADYVKTGQLGDRTKVN
ncbi:hypothetical protein [Vibrio phage vB_VpM-pA2SJ1]|uniref:Uncharacterized protein n=1 Tax=Vibrio phage vB_VpM-pA2SJ1 TaxID=3095964 RepID=A0AAX4J597_9CAUD